jgi:hypothetical protein
MVGDNTSSRDMLLQGALLYKSLSWDCFTLSPPYPTYRTFSLPPSHLELQQRACEYLVLPTVGQEIMETVMNSMPPYLDKGNALMNMHEVGSYHITAFNPYTAYQPLFVPHSPVLTLSYSLSFLLLLFLILTQIPTLFPLYLPFTSSLPLLQLSLFLFFPFFLSLILLSILPHL